MLERLLNGYVFQVITCSAEERTAGSGQNKAFDALLSGASLKRLEYCGMFAVDRENRYALFFGAGRYKLAAGNKSLLVGEAISLPASIAARVGLRPAMPTILLSTLSASS